MLNPVKYIWEMFADWVDISPWVPWAIKKRVYFFSDYLRWRTEPRGVRSTVIELKSSFILKKHYDIEDSDYLRTTCEYNEYSSEQDVLLHLKKNIRLESGLPPKLTTVKEYCQKFGFELYERKY